MCIHVYNVKKYIMKSELAYADVLMYCMNSAHAYDYKGRQRETFLSLKQTLTPCYLYLGRVVNLYKTKIILFRRKT